MSFKLGSRSLKNLKGVNYELVKVVHRAIELTTVDFTVLEGLRTRKRQVELVTKGASKTMNSRHLTGHAVDLGAWVDGTISWDWKYYHKISDAMLKAASEECVNITWGGRWPTFKDGVHYELDWKHYPLI
ncbi:MAG: hypothetical protein COA78_20220 [Blastopirellula sp.]|nr:MAG: hypothetical protein COA78_20220 [Blastopirellula sp.]